MEKKNLQHNISDDIHWRSLVPWIRQPRPNPTPRSPLPQSILLSSRGKQNPSLSVLNQPPNHNRAVLPSSLHNQILLKAPLEPSPTFPVLSFPLLLKQPSTGKKFLLVRILVGDCYSTRGRYVLKKKDKARTHYWYTTSTAGTLSWLPAVKDIIDIIILWCNTVFRPTGNPSGRCIGSLRGRGRRRMISRTRHFPWMAGGCKEYSLDYRVEVKARRVGPWSGREGGWVGCWKRPRIEAINWLFVNFFFKRT